MKNSLNKLKPKTNKLLSFVTNWRIPETEKKIELAKGLEQLITKQRYPTAIRSFFQIPLFQSLIENLHEGRISNIPLDKEKYTDYLPPKEIHNLQVLIEAFHKLVHLDYSSAKSKDSFIQAKIYGKNILEYLTVAELFIYYEGKRVDQILEYLFNSIHSFTKKFKKLIDESPRNFSYEIHENLDEMVLNRLIHLDRETFTPGLKEDWLKLFVELNIDPKLSINKKNLIDIAVSNMHKLLNQTQTALSEKRFFCEKNSPRYVPHDLFDRFEEKIDALNLESVTGQKVNELFYNIFWLEKYEIINAKQECVNKKIKSMELELRVGKDSIEHLIEEYYEFLPGSFSRYFEEMTHPAPISFSVLGKPNFLAIQGFLGFHNLKCDYLIDLLGGDEVKLPKNQELITSCYSVVTSMFSFLQRYYQINPQTSFAVIRSTLENLYSGESTWKTFSVSDVKDLVKKEIKYFIADEEPEIEFLEANLEKIQSKLQRILEFLPKDSCEYRLLNERIVGLQNSDIPTTSNMWYTFGELFSIFYTILAQIDDKFEQSKHNILEKMLSEKFIQVLLFST